MFISRFHCVDWNGRLAGGMGVTYTGRVCAITLVTVDTLANDLAVDVSGLFVSLLLSPRV
jgi:hypothetical protein